MTGATRNNEAGSGVPSEKVLSRKSVPYWKETLRMVFSSNWKPMGRLRSVKTTEALNQGVLARDCLVARREAVARGGDSILESVRGVRSLKVRAREQVVRAEEAESSTADALLGAARRT